MCTPHLTQFGSNSSSIAWSITTPSSNDTVPMEWTRRQVTVRSQPSSRLSSTDCGPSPVACVDHQGSSHGLLVFDVVVHDEGIARPMCCVAGSASLEFRARIPNLTNSKTK
uniref:Uncharacterized protein n=1 Tax=Proboscia inermis TaxID=420281 RepID=A0A7S0GAX6_9STRA